jgi:Protein of unknown function (DUF4031)
MTIFVDDALRPARVKRIKSEWSHMVSIPENRGELLRAARQLGLKPEWIRKGRQSKLHFDLTRAKRDQAIKQAIAKPVTKKKLVELIQYSKQRAV